MLRTLLLALIASLISQYANAQTAHGVKAKRLGCEITSRSAYLREAQTSTAFHDAVVAIRSFRERLSDVPDPGDVARYCNAMRVHTVNVLGIDRHLVYFPALEQMATTYALLGVTSDGEVYFLNSQVDGAIHAGVDWIKWNALLLAERGARRIDGPVEALKYGCLIHSLTRDGLPVQRCAVEAQAAVTRSGTGWEVTLHTLGQRLTFNDHGALNTIEALESGNQAHDQ